jgi:integrase
MTLIQRKGSRVWYARAIVNGKCFQRSTKTTDRRKAQKWHDSEFQRLVQLLRQSPDVSLEIDPAIVRNVARVEVDVSEREARRVGVALANVRDWLRRKGITRLDQITTEGLADYQRARVRAGASKSTLLKEVNYTLRLLRENGFHIDRPRAIRARSTPNRAFTRDELRRFFQHCPAEWQTLFLTLLCTGARPAEIVPSKQSTHVPLLKEELDPEAGTVIIRSAKSRGQVQLRRRIHRVGAELLDRLVAQADATPGPHVFRAPSIGLNHVFDRVIAAAGIEKVNALGEKVTAHSFRHTFATLFHQAVGGDLALLRRALGHTQITTTQRYDHYEGPGVVIEVSDFLPGPQLVDIDAEDA